MPLVDQTYQLMQRERIALGLLAQYDAMTTRELSAILGQPMKTLSDTTRDIDAIWVIEQGRHTVCNTNIERVISPTRDMGFFTLAHIQLPRQSREPSTLFCRMSEGKSQAQNRRHL